MVRSHGPELEGFAGAEEFLRERSRLAMIANGVGVATDFHIPGKEIAIVLDGADIGSQDDRGRGGMRSCHGAACEPGIQEHDLTGGSPVAYRRDGIGATEVKDRRLAMISVTTIFLINPPFVLNSYPRFPWFSIIKV